MTLPGAGAAWAAAAACGAIVALIARRGLAGGAQRSALLAAAARGLAVALAVGAALSAARTVDIRTPGLALTAAPDGADAPGDAVIRWPSEAPDAAAALETARALRDADRRATLALRVGSDAGRGAETAPAARGLRTSDAVASAVVPLPVRPAQAAPSAPVAIVVPAGATADVPVSLALDAGREAIGGREALVEAGGRIVRVPLPAGASRATTPRLSLAAGTHLVVADVEGRAPSAATIEVAGAPRVLAVAAPGLAAMLRAQGLAVAECADRDVGTDAIDAASVVVLGPGATGGPAAERLAARVRSGAGLLVTGGDGRDGLSRFRDTPLAALLPVEPPPPPEPPPAPPAPPPPVKRPDPAKPRAAVDEGDKEALRVALLLVIDTSGSMAGSKLSMAQQSAYAAARSLAPTDRVGVITFDDDAREAAPFQDAVAIEALFRRIGGLRPGGGTNFYPALKLGYARLAAERCGIRHVILLTDGETRPAVFRTLVESGAANAITLSTIAVGDDADTNLLALLAGWGRGKMYVATDPARLPEVVTLDTQRFSTGPRDRARADRTPTPPDELPVPPTDPTPAADASAPAPNEPPRAAALRRPHAVSMAALLAGLETARWPQLPSPESAPARPAAQVVLAWDDASPAFTLGRAGLGRVAVMAAALDAREAAEFAAWDAAPQFAAQTVRALAETRPGDAPPVEARFEEALDGRAWVSLDVALGGRLSLAGLRGGGPLDAALAPRRGESVAELERMPPAGILAGTFTAADGSVRRAFASCAGPRPLPADLADRVAAAAGAPVTLHPDAPRDGEPRRSEEPGAPILAAAAACLLVAEAALRRVARAGA